LRANFIIRTALPNTPNSHIGATGWLLIETEAEDPAFATFQSRGGHRPAARDSAISFPTWSDGLAPGNEQNRPSLIR
jgi:hypothetical protein